MKYVILLKPVAVIEAVILPLTWLIKTIWQFVHHTTILAISSLTTLFLLYPEQINLSGLFSHDELHAFAANYILLCGSFVGMILILNLCVHIMLRTEQRSKEIS